jgi:hypothetical protein
MKGAATENNCSTIAGNIVALPIPPNHAEARIKVATNAAMPTARPLAISQDNATYLTQIDSYRNSLASCGAQLTGLRAQIVPNATRYFGQMDKISKPDAQKVATAMAAYNDAGKKMVLAILALSNDKQVESHVADVIVKYFIEAARQ